MENKPAKKESGIISLPLSTKIKLDKISYDHYKKIGFRSIKDLIVKGDKLIRIKHIIAYHENPGKVIGEVFVKSLDQVGKLTGVKNWIDGEGVEFFMEYVINKYPELTLGDVQVFCYQVIEGKFGHAFENISVQKLIMWFDEYDQYRSIQIYDSKKLIESKEQKIDQADIDPDGFRRQAEAYGKVYQKHLKKMASKQPNYLSIYEYIERNELDEVEFMGELKEKFEVELSGLLDEHEGYDRSNLPHEFYQSMYRKFVTDFLIEENKKLK